MSDLVNSFADAQLPAPRMPNPPRLHWGWVFGLNAITRGLFGIAWLIVQANWVRKVLGRSRAFTWSIIHACVFILGLVAIFSITLVMAVMQASPAVTHEFQVDSQVLYLLAILIAYYATVYMLRSELQSAQIGIPLGGVMTFFFGTVYFQYHLRDYGGVSSTFGDSGQIGLGLRGPVTPIMNEGAAALSPPMQEPPAQG